MKRLAATLLAVMVAASQGGTARAESNDGSRLILLFVVNPPDDNAKKGVVSWIQSFKNNVRYLLADSTGTSDSGRNIKVIVSTENVDDVTPDMLEASFGRQPSLQVLSTVGRFGGQSTFVDNDIYLGDLKGSLAIPYVHISQEILPGRYQITREALAAVTLYAYAMAVANTSPDNRYGVCRALDQANMYKDRDLDPEARGHLQNLFRAISAELESRSCGGKR
jgi:hypothetical protein